MIAACRKISFALLAAAAASLCVSAYAQSGGATLQGTVTDSSGAVVRERSDSYPGGTHRSFARR